MRPTYTMNIGYQIALQGLGDTKMARDLKWTELRDKQTNSME